MSAVAATNTGEDLFVSSTKAKADEAAENNNASQVSQDQFLELLVAQMTNQDPLSPMSNEQFIQQLAQLQSLDEQIKTNDYLGQMAGENQLASASGMIGSYIHGLDRSNDPVEGIVTHVTLSDGKYFLNLNGDSQVELADVTQVDVVVAGGE